MIEIKKTVIIICLLCFVIGSILCGCTQQNNNGNTNITTMTMTVEELYDDIVPTSMIFGMIFNSLDDGDTLIIEDKIPENTNYDTDRDATVMQYSMSDGNFYINVEGDITDIFKPMDDYSLTVHIKYVELKWEDDIIELECFDEQWVSQEYFFENIATGGLKPLPQNCIGKM